MRYDLVIGLGEMGSPILKMISESVLAYGLDLGGEDPPDGEVHCVHICYPYGERFISATVNYIKRLRPRMCIIHSTVAPGTTRKIGEVTRNKHVYGRPLWLAYSPVRGRRGHFDTDLRHYTKFVAGISGPESDAACTHLNSLGFKAVIAESPETLELGKLVETAYVGVLIAWAQEMDRFCRELGVDYSRMMATMKELRFVNREFYPGHIGGHCVIPNLDLLEQVRPSYFARAIRASNDEKKVEWESSGIDLDERHCPKELT